MRKLVVVLIVLAAAAPCGAAGWELGLAAGVPVTVGLAYGGAWDPGLSGGGLQALFEARRDWYAAEAGVEAALSPIGWQVLFPARGGVRWAMGPVVGEALLEAAPGLSLTRPALFMVGLGGLVRAVWDPTPGFGLYLDAGVRLTLCPAYAGYTGHTYASLDIPVGIGVRWFWTRPS